MCKLIIMVIHKRIATVGHVVIGIKHISGFSKLAPKEYKIRHDWVRKMIHWELCKKLKNERHKIP